VGFDPEKHEKPPRSSLTVAASLLLPFNPYKAGSPHHCAHPLNQKYKHLLSLKMKQPD
jgi:hypothetical protein